MSLRIASVMMILAAVLASARIQASVEAAPGPEPAADSGSLQRTRMARVGLQAPGCATAPSLLTAPPRTLGFDALPTGDATGARMRDFLLALVAEVRARQTRAHHQVLARYVCLGAVLYPERMQDWTQMAELRPEELVACGQNFLRQDGFSRSLNQVLAGAHLLPEIFQESRLLLALSHHARSRGRPRELNESFEGSLRLDESRWVPLNGEEREEAQKALTELYNRSMTQFRERLRAQPAYRSLPDEAWTRLLESAPLRRRAREHVESVWDQFRHEVYGQYLEVVTEHPVFLLHPEAELTARSWWQAIGRNLTLHDRFREHLIEVERRLQWATPRRATPRDLGHALSAAAELAFNVDAVNTVLESRPEYCGLAYTVLRELQKRQEARMLPVAVAAIATMVPNPLARAFPLAFAAASSAGLLGVSGTALVLLAQQERRQREAFGANPVDSERGLGVVMPLEPIRQSQVAYSISLGSLIVMDVLLPARMIMRGMSAARTGSTAIQSPHLPSPAVPPTSRLRAVFHRLRLQGHDRPNL